MTGITRRAVLASAGAVAVAGVPGAVLAEDAMLQRRYAEWEAAYEAFGHALDELALVEKKVWAAAKAQGVEHGTEAYETLGREFGVDAAYENEDRTADQEREAYECFLNTPASSSQDIVFKIRTAQKNKDSAAETVLVQALSRDFERLIGGIRP